MKALLLSAVLIVGLGCFIVLDEVLIVDFTVISPIQFPSNNSWKVYLESRRDEVIDGPTDRDFLNTAYLGGWNRCIYRFAKHIDSLPWNYYVVRKNRPMDLGGNMTDSERVAGQLGWRHATDEIELILSRSSESDLRSRIYYVNRFLLIYAGVGLLAILLGALLDLGLINKWKRA